MDPRSVFQESLDDRRRTGTGGIRRLQRILVAISCLLVIISISLQTSKRWKELWTKGVRDVSMKGMIVALGQDSLASFFIYSAVIVALLEISPAFMWSATRCAPGLVSSQLFLASCQLWLGLCVMGELDRSISVGASGFLLAGVGVGGCFSAIFMAPKKEMLDTLHALAESHTWETSKLRLDPLNSLNT